MNKQKKKRKFKTGLAILISAIVIGGITSSLLFWNSSYIVPKVKVSSQLIDKVRKSQVQDVTLELNSEELNEIIGMYSKKDQSFGRLTIKGIHVEVVNNNLRFSIPADYIGVKALISSEGSLSYNNGKIQYLPIFFKMGKITIPKEFVLKEIGKHLTKGIYLENNSIAVDSAMFPGAIKSLEVKNNKLVISFANYTSSLEAKLKSIGDKLKGAVGGEGSNKLPSNVASEVKSSISSTSSNGNTTSGSNNSTGTGSRGEVSAFDAALDRINGGLSNAQGNVSTSGQKAVIYELMSAVSSMKGNPNANPYESAGTVRSVYNNLTSQEKNQLKVAIFSNINGNDINIVSKMMGK